MALSRIGQIAITVSDVPKALAFVKAGDVRVMLSTPQGSGAVGANSILYFHVTGIEAAHAKLVAKMPDHELWLGFLRDPDGNLVGLMEEKRAQ